jgi:hypothetical protein
MNVASVKSPGPATLMIFAKYRVEADISNNIRAIIDNLRRTPTPDEVLKDLSF